MISYITVFLFLPMYVANRKKEGLSNNELMLSVDQIEAVEFYLQCKVELDVNICSPLRPDPQPGCRFAIDKQGLLVLFDYSRGTSYTLLSMIEDFKSVTNLEARKLLIEDFFDNPIRIYKEPRVLTAKSREFDLKVACRKIEQYDCDLWSIAPDVKIIEKDLSSHGVCPLIAYSINGHSFVMKGPAYLFNLGSTKQIYRPDLPKKSNSYEGRYRSNTVHGLYGVSFLKDDWYVVVTKSYRDWFYLQKLNINSLFVLSESHNFTEDEKAILKKHKVFLLYDNDLTGIIQATELKAIGYIPLYLLENDTVDNIKEHGGKKTKTYLMKKINDYKK